MRRRNRTPVVEEGWPYIVAFVGVWMMVGGFVLLVAARLYESFPQLVRAITDISRQLLIVTVRTALDWPYGTGTVLVLLGVSLVLGVSVWSSTQTPDDEICDHRM